MSLVIALVAARFCCASLANLCFVQVQSARHKGDGFSMSAPRSSSRLASMRLSCTHLAAHRAEIDTDDRSPALRRECVLSDSHQPSDALEYLFEAQLWICALGYEPHMMTADGRYVVEI